MITKKQIQEAANNHAVKILGEEQAKSNPMANKSISEDFKDGVNWVFQQIEDRLMDGDSYKMPDAIDYHALGFDVVEAVNKLSTKNKNNDTTR